MDTAQHVCGTCGYVGQIYPSGKSPYYVLDGDGNPKHEPCLMCWATWFEKNDPKQVIAQNEVKGQEVSTAFLSIDSGLATLLDPDGPPVLWETAHFTPDETGPRHIWRHTSREEAQTWHDQIVTALQNGDPLP